MAREYMCLYHSYLETASELTDEEFGRLIRASLEYSRDGTTRPLTGNEKILYPTFRWQIDKDKDYFEDIGKKRKSAGSAGGKSKAKQTVAKEANDSKAKQTVAKVSKTSNANANDNANVNNISSSATAEADLAACTKAYEQNIGPIARAAFDDISRQLADLPADLICEAIGEAALNNKRSWNYVKAILKRCREQNILSVDAYRAEKENHAAAAATRAATTAPSQSKQAAIRERLKKRLEETGGVQGDEPTDNRLYAEAVELVAEPLPGE